MRRKISLVLIVKLASRARVRLSQAQQLVVAHLVAIIEDYLPPPKLLSLALSAPATSLRSDVTVYHTSQSFQDCCIQHILFTNLLLFPFVHPRLFATEFMEPKVLFMLVSAAELFC